MATTRYFFGASHEHFPPEAHYRARDLKLHTLPERRPPIWVSAFGPQAAAVAGRWGDGLWTLPDPESTPEVIEAFREAGGAGEIVFQALFSWAETDEAAFEAARRWKGAQPEDHYNNSGGAGGGPISAIEVYGEQVLPALRGSGV